MERVHSADYKATFSDRREIKITNCRDRGLARLLAAEAHCNGRRPWREIVRVERLPRDPDRQANRLVEVTGPQTMELVPRLARGRDHGKA